MAGVNIIIEETDEEAQRLATSLIRMIVGIFVGKRDFVQPPTDLTNDLKEFIEQTKTDELIADTNIYDVNDPYDLMNYLQRL